MTPELVYLDANATTRTDPRVVEVSWATLSEVSEIADAPPPAAEAPAAAPEASANPEGQG